MKATLLGALSFIGIAVLVVLVFGPEQKMVRDGRDVDTAARTFPQGDEGQTQVSSAVRTPDSVTPAAGVCDASVDRIVSVAIMEDVPSPRCAKVAPGQKLRVENRTMERITVFFSGTSNSAASREYPIVPGDAALIDAPVEAYLAPGVHHLTVTGYSSPEIWFGAPNEGSSELLDR